MSTQTVLLIDADRRFGQFLEGLLSAAGFYVRGPYPELAEVLGRHDPDLVVMDPVGRGPAARQPALAAARRLFPKAALAVVSADLSDAALADSMLAGAVAHLGKDMTEAGLLHGLQLALSGHAVFPDRAMSLLDPSDKRANVHDLSPREAQILSCLLASPSNRAIADRLNISESTVKMHFKNLLRKIGAANRTQAAIWAMDHGITPMP